MIRALSLILGLLLMPHPVFAQKAGVGAWENSRYTTLEWIESTPTLSWYYNWRPDQIWHRDNIDRSVEFVPMIHNARDVGKPIESDRPVTTLLAFNEPDGPGDHQSALTVEEAIRLWPKLEARGLRLGSPATMQSGTLGRNSWQRRFMDQAEARNLRVDFMAVHYYSTNGRVSDFRRWLKAVYTEYQRPIWVTEFAYIDWDRPRATSHAENAAFITEAILMMEALPFVERHAWFAMNPYDWGGVTPRINLVEDDLTPTPVGLAFDQVLTDIGTERVATLRR